MKEKFRHLSWLSSARPLAPTQHAKDCLERIRRMLNVSTDRQREIEPEREPGQDDEEVAA